MKERTGPRGLWDSIKRQAPELSTQLPELPVLAHQALSRMEYGHRQRQRQIDAVSDMRHHMSRQNKRQHRLRLGLIVLAIALAWQPLGGWAAGQDWPVLAAGAIGLLLLAW